MQFELNDILTVIDKVKNTELSFFEYEDADTKIKIKGTAPIVYSPSEVPAAVEKTVQKAAVPVNPAGDEETSCAYIHSPMVGTFYAAQSEGAEPFVSVGDSISQGEVVGIIEAMKLMNEIEADCDGVVEEILVQNEQMVEFGQPLFKIRLKEV